MHGFTTLRFVLGVFMLFCLMNLTMSDRCIGIHNGCNSYGFFEGYKDLFTPACNEHDACYFCVSSHFFIDINSISLDPNTILLQLCIQFDVCSCSYDFGYRL